LDVPFPGLSRELWARGGVRAKNGWRGQTMNDRIIAHAAMDATDRIMDRIAGLRASWPESALLICAPSGNSTGRNRISSDNSM